MKIKRYTAPSMRIALDQVRIEQGVDAVILSSRRIPEGIEVIAAVDYDETLMVAARPQRSTPTPSQLAATPSTSRLGEGPGQASDRALHSPSRRRSTSPGEERSTSAWSSRGARARCGLR